MTLKALALFIAFFITFALTPLTKKVAVYIGAIDKPNERKIHQGIIPRLGGVPIYFGFMLTMIIFADMTSQMVGILIGGTIIMIFGVLDDVKELSPKVKILGQVLAAIVLISFGVKVDFVSNPFGGDKIPLYLFSIPITIIWIVGIVNALNLIDGLDGLASGIAIIAAVVLAITSWLTGLHTILVALCLAASTLGFLKYNFNPAQIFLGDSGSMFLGFNLGAFAIVGLTKSAALVSIFIPILILGIPISDTFVAIIRRYINRQPIFKADKGHIHHQLIALGLSQKQAVLIIYAISAFFGMAAFALTKINKTQALIIFIAVIIIVGITVLKIRQLVNNKKSMGHTNWLEHANNKFHNL